MAVVLTIDVGGFDYGFDFEDQRIDIDASIDVLSVIDLYTAIKDAQDDPVAMPYTRIANASGRDELSPGVETFLTVSLLENWEVSTLKVAGQFTVGSGNLIRADGADPFRDNPLITYINNLSQAGVLVITSGDGALTPEQAAQLDAIESNTDQILLDTTQLLLDVAQVLVDTTEIKADVNTIIDEGVSGSGGGGGGLVASGDWSYEERAQIRYVLGIDGRQEPATPNLGIKLPKQIRSSIVAGETAKLVAPLIENIVETLKNKPDAKAISGLGEMLRKIRDDKSAMIDRLRKLEQSSIDTIKAIKELPEPEAFPEPPADRTDEVLSAIEQSNQSADIMAGIEATREAQKLAQDAATEATQGVNETIGNLMNLISSLAQESANTGQTVDSMFRRMLREEKASL